MYNTFTELKPEQITENPFERVGADRMLVTAGNKDSFNMMTAGWG
ncbi:MAG TPA: flavin reductase, partial [Ruminiclostridium sp.]|nr:flavin reductase [Ruminiclostridium sp.]